MKPAECLTRRDWGWVLAMLVATAAILALLGREWWCSAGDLNPWSSETHSLHNSQHLFDPYTFTHVLHGLGFYAMFWWVGRDRLSRRQRWLGALGLESAWEVFENTSFVIERYRSETISLGYYGDSIANSVGDIVACVVGLMFAARAPLWASALLFVAAELALLAWIRDSLILNIVMLLWPLDWIRQWQQGG